MFQIGDTVLYGLNGACKISDICAQKFSDTTREYYLLTPINTKNSMIYVPIDNEALVGKMRRILSAEEIHALIREIPQEQSIWIEDEQERKEKFREILDRGDRRELIGIIKSLYQNRKAQQARGRKFHVTDEKLFNEAEKLLYEEFALVLQIPPEQVLPFILDEITRAQDSES